MFFDSLFGKFGFVALLVVGVASGLVVTGSLPDVGQRSHYRVASASPPAARAGITLDFPTSVLQQRAPEVSPPVEIVEEVVVVPVSHAPARQTGAPATVAAPKCVAEVTTALNAIVASVPSVTTAEQGHALLGQANAVGAAADSCLVEARSVGSSGVDGIGQLVNQAGQLVAQIGAIPVVAGSGSPPEGPANPVGGLVGGVGSVVGGTLNLVGGGLDMLGTGLNMLTRPLSSTDG